MQSENGFQKLKALREKRDNIAFGNGTTTKRVRNNNYIYLMPII